MIKQFTLMTTRNYVLIGVLSRLGKAFAAIVPISVLRTVSDTAVNHKGV